MTAYSRAGDPDGAELVLKRMEAAGASPNVLTYNTLLSATSRMGLREGEIEGRRAKRVLQIYDTMRRSAGMGQGLERTPDEATYTVLLTCLLNFPKPLALEVYKLVLEDWRKLVPVRNRSERNYQSFISLLAAVGDWKEMATVFGEAQARFQKGQLPPREFSRVEATFREKGGYFMREGEEGGKQAAEGMEGEGGGMRR
eukprot:evm.model.NODE_5555_length_12449_cov_31.447346.5